MSAKTEEQMRKWHLAAEMLDYTVKRWEGDVRASFQRHDGTVLEVTVEDREALLALHRVIDRMTRPFWPT